MALEFPAFLDFLYGESLNNMRASQPWAMIKLADYFGVESLQQQSSSYCAHEMFLLTKAQFVEKSQDISSAVLVCIMTKVMEIARGRERQVADNLRVSNPIKM
jgi:hypothetical protein